LRAGLFRLVVKDIKRLHVPRSTEVALEEVRASARRILGTDLGQAPGGSSGLTWGRATRSGCAGG
jgi:hypothetical protein